MTEDALAEELRSRGRSLIRMGQDMLRCAEMADGRGASGMEALDVNREILMLAKAALDDRKRRTNHFRSDLFGEPGWHILLDLFIEQQVGKKLSVTAACIGSGAPTTTALRYLNLLIEDGLIEREGDPGDGRRSWLKLTALAVEAMTEYLSSGCFADGSGAAVDRGVRRELT